jgi:hypothetical protein
MRTAFACALVIVAIGAPEVGWAQGAKVTVTSYRDTSSGKVWIKGRVTSALSPYQNPVVGAPVDIEVRTVENTTGILLFATPHPTNLFTDAAGEFGVSVPLWFQHPNNGTIEAYRVFAGVNGLQDYKQVVYITRQGIQIGLAMDWGGSIYELWTYPNSWANQYVDNFDTGALIQASMYASGPWLNPAQAGGYSNATGNVKNPISWLYYVPPDGSYLRITTETQMMNHPSGQPTDNQLTDFWVTQEVTMPVVGNYVDLRYVVKHEGSDAHSLGEGELPSMYYLDSIDPTVGVCAVENYHIHNWAPLAEKSLKLTATSWAIGSELKPARPNIIRSIPASLAGRRVLYVALLSTEQASVPLNGGVVFDRSYRIAPVNGRAQCP